jgi:hypothetical protein
MKSMKYKALLESKAAIIKLFLLVLLVREHAKFKIEEFTLLAALVQIRLVDLVPEPIQICVNDSPDLLEVVSSAIEIPQNEEQFLVTR